MECKGKKRRIERERKEKGNRTGESVKGVKVDGTFDKIEELKG